MCADRNICHLMFLPDIVQYAVISFRKVAVIVYDLSSS